MVKKRKIDVKKEIQDIVPVKSLKNIKNPDKFIIYEVKTNSKNGKRKVGFCFTGKKGFGKWKIKYNRQV